MGNSSILAIGNAVIYDIKTLDVIATSESLTTSGINLGITMDEVRGGSGNALQGYLPHTTMFGLTLEDSVFKMEYMALNCGGEITSSADVMTVTTITTTELNKITAPTVPVAMAGLTKVYGWYKLPTDENWTTVEFVGQDATVVGLAIGTEICLKYMHTDASSRGFTIGGRFLPKIVRVEMSWSLFATSDSADGGQTLIGELQYEIPKFQLIGTQAYSVTASGTTTTPLNGSALINKSAGCGVVGGYYALVKEVIYDRGTFDNVVGLLIEGSAGGFEIEAGDSEQLKVYAKYNDSTAITKLDNSLFTFTSSATGVATVGANTGIVTGVADGDATITVVATAKPTLETNCTFTVPV